MRDDALTRHSCVQFYMFEEIHWNFDLTNRPGLRTFGKLFRMYVISSVFYIGGANNRPKNLYVMSRCPLFRVPFYRSLSVYCAMSSCSCRKFLVQLRYIHSPLRFDSKVGESEFFFQTRNLIPIPQKSIYQFRFPTNRYVSKNIILIPIP